MVDIHPSAIVEKGARLDEGVTIGPFCRIGSEVTIGKGTTVASHTVIEGKTTIGTHNRIFSHAALGTIPQDLKYKGEKSELIIGDRNIIREFTLFNTGTEGGGMVTRIGNDNLFMGYVHVGHDAKIGNKCILANVATLGGHVELGDHVVIGGLSAVHQFVKLGDYVMIGGGSPVVQDIPPYCLAEGNRAQLRGLNLTGLRRSDISRTSIDALKRAYKALFLSGKPVKESAMHLMEQSRDDLVKNLCKFVLESKRGIPYKRNMTTKE